MTATKTAVVMLGLAAGANATALVKGALESPPGPVAVAWDRQTCAHCGMHVGDPRFAAQLRMGDGDVYHFDDVGCLARFEAALGPGDQAKVKAVYVRDSSADRWIDLDHAAFLPGADTPMGSGFAAVEAGSPGSGGALGWEAAKARALVDPGANR